MVLFHQLLDVGEHQDPPPGFAGQLCNHQTLAGPGGQYYHGGIRVFAKMLDDGVDGVCLVGP